MRCPPCTIWKLRNLHTGERPGAPRPGPAPSRPWPGTAALMLAVMLFQGCAAFQPVGTEYEEWLALELRPESTRLRPGEAIVMEARLRNLSDSAVEARALNADSVQFSLLNQATGESLTRRAVASPREDLSVVEPLAPGEETKRLFLLTDAALTSGAFALQAIYTTPIDRESVSPMAISPPIAYTVTGERLFTRGPDGLISRDDAIGLAQRALNRPCAEARAALVQNEAGFLDWYVGLTIAPEALAEGENPSVGFLVNPYLGQARGRTQTDVEQQLR